MNRVRNSIIDEKWKEEYNFDTSGLKLLVDPARQMKAEAGEVLGENIVQNGDFSDFTLDLDRVGRGSSAEILSNTSFDADANGYADAGNGGTISWSDTEGHNSAGALVYTVNSGSDSDNFITLSNAIFYKANTWYRVECWVKLPGTWDGGGLRISQHGTAWSKFKRNSVTTFDNNWHKLWAEFQFSFDVILAGFKIETTDGVLPTSNPSFYVDDFSLKQVGVIAYWNFDTKYHAQELGSDAIYADVAQHKETVVSVSPHGSGYDIEDLGSGEYKFTKTSSTNPYIFFANSFTNGKFLRVRFKAKVDDVSQVGKYFITGTFNFSSCSYIQNPPLSLEYQECEYIGYLSTDDQHFYFGIDVGYSVYVKDISFVEYDGKPVIPSAGFDFRNQMTGSSPIYKGGNAVELDGVDDYFYIPKSQAQDFNPGTSDFSVSGWFYYTDLVPSPNRYLFSCGRAENYWVSLLVPQSTNVLKLQVRNKANSTLYGCFIDITTQSWHHYTIVRRNTTFNLYVDGTLQATMDTGSIIDFDFSLFDFYIGCYSSNYGYWDSCITETAYYNRALTEQEVKEIYGLAKGWSWDGVGLVNNNNFSQVISDGGIITQSLSTSAKTLYKKQITKDDSTSINYLNEDNYTISLSNGNYSLASIRPVLNVSLDGTLVEDFSKGGIKYVFNEHFSNWTDLNSDGIDDIWISGSIQNDFGGAGTVSFIVDEDGGIKYQRIEVTNAAARLYGKVYDYKTGDLIKIKVKYRSNTDNWGMRITDNTSLTSLFDVRNTNMEWREQTLYVYAQSDISPYVDWGFFGSHTGILDVAFIEVAKVESISGNHGLMQGDMEDLQPSSPMAWELDGVDDYIDFGDVCNVGTNDFIFFAWVNDDKNLSSYPAILSLDSDSGTHPVTELGCRQGAIGGQAFFLVSNTSDTFFEARGINNLSGWNFLCGVKKANQISLYVNLVKQADITFSGTVKTSGRGYLKMGVNQYDGSNGGYLGALVGISGIYIFDGQDGAPSSLPPDYEERYIKGIYNWSKAKRKEYFR